MERGIYFDGWHKHDHCFHPSLPLRNNRMLEDLKRYHGTVLVWAGMGGGSISLPYLEQEAFGDVDPRMRFYGGMNDSEFAAECGKLGIRLFGIVFEVQGWEFPAVFDERGHILRLNEHAEQQDHDWYGIREFSQDRYPDAFRTSLRDYYPDGIVNSAGEKVTDLWEECTTRDMYGKPVHAEWVEVKDHAQQAYQMCRNNPVWRDYLKKIMQIQIDAGVQGVQLDECELPMTSIGSGGCFCRDCMSQFTQYLIQKRAEGTLSADWDGIDVEHFNYKEYLLEGGHPYPDGAPFFKDYWEFQVTQVRKYFSELADYARDYAMEKYGRRLEVSGNFYNLQPAYHPIVPKADIIITEMEHTLFRQPYFYRYSAGFAEGKPVIVAENPYGGIIPAMLELLDRGKAYDLYRIFLLEASVYGCNMSVPYGAWMGNTIRDAFWPPRSVTTQVQDFLYEHEDFFPAGRTKGAAVLYSYGSNYWRDAHRSGSANGDAAESNAARIDVMATDWGNSSVPMPFWDVIRCMSGQNALYDVMMMPDGVLREDDFDPQSLDGYRMLVVPDCVVLTKNQEEAILRFARTGAPVLIYGRLAEGSDLAGRLKACSNVCFVPEGIAQFSEIFTQMYSKVTTAECADRRIGMNRYDSEEGTFVHLINYDYREDTDGVEPVAELTLRLKSLPGRAVRVLRLDGETDAYSVRYEDGWCILTLYDVPVYTAIEIRKG